MRAIVNIYRSKVDKSKAVCSQAKRESLRTWIELGSGGISVGWKLDDSNSVADFAWDWREARAWVIR